MHKKAVRARALAFACLLGLSFAGAASAQTYPARPINLVVPFPAGGGTVYGNRHDRPLQAHEPQPDLPCGGSLRDPPERRHRPAPADAGALCRRVRGCAGANAGRPGGELRRTAGRKPAAAPGGAGLHHPGGRHACIASSISMRSPGRGFATSATRRSNRGVGSVRSSKRTRPTRPCSA